MLRTLRLAFLSLCVAATAAAQSPLPNDARTALEQAVTVGREAERLLALYPPIATPTTVAELQAALTSGPLLIHLPASANLSAGSFVISRSGTTILGNGARLHGTSGPAIHILPGVDDVYVSGVSATSAFQSVVQCGDNVAATQSTLAQVPERITFVAVTIPTHRNKRGFEINCTGQQLGSFVYDLWDPAGQDSQGIAILNTPGPWLVDGGEYAAGSEVALLGGDTMKIPGVIPSDITFRRTRLFRPLSWRTDGVARKAKALFEAKTGDRVLVEDTILEGCYRDAWADCYGIVLTPRSGGAVTNVTFQRVTVRDVTTAIQITGRDNVTQTPARTTGIVFRDSTFRADRTLTAIAGSNGRGILMLSTMAPDAVTFEDVVFVGDGTQLVYSGDNERMGSLRFVNSLATTGVYGLMGAGYVNGTNWATWVDVLEVTGNTFTGEATAFRNNFPSNTYVDRPTFDALVGL